MKLAAALLGALAAAAAEQPRTVSVGDWADCSDDASSLVQARSRALFHRQEAATLKTSGPTESIREMDPLRSTLLSIEAVLVIYFASYVVMAIVHAFNQAKEFEQRPLEKALESLIMGMSFAPMLCTLFLSVFMRTDVLTRHDPGKYDLPANYVRFALPVCVGAVALQMVLHIVREWFFNTGGSTNRFYILSMYFYNIAMCFMYGSALVIIVGLIFMSQPEEVLKLAGPLKLSPAVFCCNCLLVLYFVVHAALHISKMLDVWNLGRGVSPAILTEPSRYVIEVLKIAAMAIQLAPMLAVLFIAVQLTVDVEVETFPVYVETCMYFGSFLLFVQVAVAIITPFATRAQLKASPGRAELVDFVTDRPRLFMLLSIVRGFCMLAMYLSLFAIGVYLWSRTDAPIWVVLVVHLGSYYLLVYLLFWLTVTFRQFSDAGMTDGLRTMVTAKDTVAICPMLAVLFMHSFLKASSMINDHGAPGRPQGFAQDYMFVATYAMLLQLILCLVNGLFFTAPADTKLMRSCGHLVRAGLSLVSIFFYLSMLTVFTCTLMVLASVFTISPQTATGAGAWF
eukprot:TRINITY_DN108650_c0_g1_i1.p1 TRINITY_DN108650_c0_g1~~TRINITY_DN108650_c0_g1_i1.p1  ORF type:complete len:594 (+),score=83.62 TRINITY_DN108650_c0_g1_i1:82-1782(+)